MFARTVGLWRNLLTEDDANSVYCPVRVFGSGGIVTYLGLAAHTVFKTGAFDMIGFGTGFAALLGALGGAIGAKAKLGG